MENFAWAALALGVAFIPTPPDAKFLGLAPYVWVDRLLIVQSAICFVLGLHDLKVI